MNWTEELAFAAFFSLMKTCFFQLSFNKLMEIHFNCEEQVDFNQKIKRRRGVKSVKLKSTKSWLKQKKEEQ